MTRTKALVAVLVVVLLFYFVLVGAKGVALLGSGSLVGVVLGIALIVLPVLGALLVWREVQFGRRTGELAAVLDREGGLPLDDLPRRPSGRVDRAAADAVFTQRRAEVDADPTSWRAWFRLSLAYDDAGDRTRAREAARKAVALHDASQQS